ncbi:MAG: hypothetical protein ACREMR_00090 [Gemmatimonadales bacterium]
MPRSLVPLLVAALPAGAPAQVRPVAAEAPFAVEYYYTVRWGYQDEFLRLYKKNHYPVLMKEKDKGRILEVTAVQPRYHATEDGRWDYRVSIVYRNVTAAYDPEPITEAELKQLFPDQETFRREEQRRFEILEAHWDVPVRGVSLP